MKDIVEDCPKKVVGYFSAVVLANLLRVKMVVEASIGYKFVGT